MPARPARTALVLAYGVTIRDEGHREHVSGQADLYDEPRARVVSWPPLRPTRLRRERGSVVVVSPTAPVEPQQRGAQEMQRVIGMDIHRTFAEVVFWEAGRLRPAGRIDMTRSGLEGFGRSLSKEDEVVVEATGNAMAVVRVLSPYVARVIVANPLQVKAIAHAHVKTDKIDAGVLASLRAAGFLPEVWLPDAETELRRRLVARRNQVVRHRTQIKNGVHSILQAHLIPPCPHADLFGRLGRNWLGRQELPVDEWAAIDRHLRELDRLGEDLAVLDREISERMTAHSSDRDQSFQAMVITVSMES